MVNVKSYDRKGNRVRRNTAIMKAREGDFEFIEDIKQGSNLVRYKTPTGIWKEKYIEVI
jgi:hypothetical protein